MLLKQRQKIGNITYGIIFGLLTMLLIWVSCASLQWRMNADSTIMMYAVLLIDKFNFIPYQDIYDMNLPGTYLIYYLIGHFSDYSDFGFRVADIIVLVGILTSTWFWLRQISWKVAWGFMVSFGLIYFSTGAEQSLERDYMLILPLSIAILLTVSLPEINNKVKHLSVGLLCGISFLVKPHSILFYIAVAGYQLWDLKKNDGKYNYSAAIKTVLYYSAGFMIPNLIAIIYLWSLGSFQYLLEIFKNYVPLYSHLNGDIQMLYGADRTNYIIKQFFRFGSGFRSNIYWDKFSLIYWFLPAVLGAFFCLRFSQLSVPQKKLVYMLIALAFISAIYPVFSGQFFFYHYFPLMYFILLLSSLSLLEFNKAGVVIKLLAMIAFISVFFFKTYYHLPKALEAASIPHEYVDSHATILEENVAEGETVQPLDWTAGTIHAMLKAKVKIATPFICDYIFYHDVSTPYMQSLRRKFINNLKETRPKLIIQVSPDIRTFVSGPDTTRDFPELTNLLQSDYEEMLDNPQEIALYLRKN